MAMPFSKKNRFWRKTRFWFHKRSRQTRTELGLVVLILLSCFLTYLALAIDVNFFNDPEIVVWLLNIDIVLVFILSLFVGRRILSLWASRNKEAAGSKLHKQLVMTFGILAALPAIIMAIFSALFFYFGVQSWFSNRVSSAIDNSLSVAEAYLHEHEKVIQADGYALATDFSRDASLLLSDTNGLQRFIATQSYIRNLPEIALFRGDGHVIVRTELVYDFNPVNVLTPTLRSFLDSNDIYLLADNENQRIRAVIPVKNYDDLYFYAARPIDEKVLSYLQETRNASEEYTELKSRSSAFQVSITFIFITVSLLMVLAAIWLGLLVARRLVRPISTLVDATQKVSQGDLATRINERERSQVEEFDTLAIAFNHMTEQLDKQRQDLIRANSQLDERRRFTETVLAGVSSGILGIDQNYKISLVNENAADLFQISKEEMIGQEIASFFPQVAPIIDQAFEHKNLLAQDNIIWERKDGRKRTFLIRVAISLIGDDSMGAVITFDDITELESAQRKAAWGDVARRIAHEIKNPLTPIQLATERLKRKYEQKFEDKEDQEIFQGCTETIIRHVSDIQNMVNEFSTFARMPSAKMSETDLEKICREVIVFYRQTYPEITFSLENTSKKKYKLRADENLLHQAITNVVKNAIEAMQEADVEKPQIAILLEYSKKELVIKVLDNGPGLKADMKEKVLEPYITTKEKGSGLGLAIVKRIIEEHKGSLDIEKSSLKKYQKFGFDKGVAFIIHLPNDSI